MVESLADIQSEIHPQLTYNRASGCIELRNTSCWEYIFSFATDRDLGGSDC